MTPTNENDNTIAFSQLRERAEHQPIIDFLKTEFPFVHGIEVASPMNIAGLYGVLADGTLRRLAFLSAGIYKIVSMLVATASIRNGIILIDEIENGIFYEKYPAIWRILYSFAQKTESQIFVTSHSDECLRALPDIIDGKPNDFSLLRTSRENGACKVEHINGIAVKAALSGGNEIRGASGARSHHA